MSEATAPEIKLSDEQITTILTVCGEIAAIQHEIPKPPPGFSTDPAVQAEISRHLRDSVEKHRERLALLGTTLAVAGILDRPSPSEPYVVVVPPGLDGVALDILKGDDTK